MRDTAAEGAFVSYSRMRHMRSGFAVERRVPADQRIGSALRDGG